MRPITSTLCCAATLFLLSLAALDGTSPRAQSASDAPANADTANQASDQSEPNKPTSPLYSPGKGEIIPTDGLTNEEIDAVKAAVKDLHSASYAIRERATLTLMLMPSAVGPIMEKAISHASGQPSGKRFPIQLESEEAISRARDVLDVFRSADSVSMVIARILGIDSSSLSEAFLEPKRAEELVSGIPANLIPHNPKVLAKLFVTASHMEARSGIIALMTAAEMDLSLADLFSALAKHESAAPDARYALMQWVGTHRDASELLELGALALNVQGSLDPTRVESILREGLSSKLAPQEVFDRFESEQEASTKRLYLLIATLEGVSEELRQAWIEVEFDALPEELQTAYLTMACRENLHEALELRIGKSSMPPQFYRLLAVIGSAELWQRALTPETSARELRNALSWLPYSKLSATQQAETLWSFADHEDSGVRDTVLSLLRGYGTPNTLEQILSRLQSSPTSSGMGALLACHGWLLPQVESTPWREAWWKELTASQRTHILAWYQGEEADEELRWLLLSDDESASYLARTVLRLRTDSVLGAQIRALDVVESLNYQPATQVLPILLTDADEVRSRLEIAATQLDDLLPDTNRHHFNPDHNFRWHRARLDLVTLILLKDQATLDAIEEEEYKQFESTYLPLVPLSKLASDPKATAEFVARDPARVLDQAPMMTLEGRDDLVLEAIRVLNERLEMRSEWSLDRAHDIEVLSSMARLLASAQHRPKLGESIVSMARNRAEAIATLPMICTSLNTGSTDTLRALSRVSLNTVNANYQVRLLLAAAAAPELTSEWIADMNKRWQALKSFARTEQALELLNAIVEADEQALFSMLNSYDRDIRLAAAAALARQGNRSCFHLLVDSMLAARNPVVDSPLGIPWSSEAAIAANAFWLESWCEGIPSKLSPQMEEMVWESTRYVWRFDAESHCYSLQAEEQE